MELQVTRLEFGVRIAHDIVRERAIRVEYASQISLPIWHFFLICDSLLCISLALTSIHFKLWNNQTQRDLETYPEPHSGTGKDSR